MILRLIRASQHIAYVIYRSTIQIDRGPCEPHCIKVMLVFPALGCGRWRTLATTIWLYQIGVAGLRHRPQYARHSPAVDEILYS